MTTFADLFPEHPLAKPFEPVQVGGGGLRSRVEGIQARARQALNMGTPAEQPQPDTRQWQSRQGAIQPEGETRWGDTGRAFIAGVGDIGSMAAGLGEHVAGQLARDVDSPVQEEAAALQGTFTRGRQASQGFAERWAASMSPEAQQRAAREILTLDPNRTIWQGDVGDFVSAIGLKIARSAPSTLASIVPHALMMRAGLGNGAIASLGATEALFSAGSVAANTASEIEKMSDQELMESESYARMRESGVDEATARQKYTAEAQGWAPAIAGIVSGAIGAAAGRYIAPVFTEKAAGLMGRMGRGYVAEAGQEAGQSSAEQMAQNYAAQMFDSDRGLMEGVGEAGIQGAMVGGPMGAAVGGAFGQRREQAIPAPQEVPAETPAEVPAAAATAAAPAAAAPARTAIPRHVDEDQLARAVFGTGATGVSPPTPQTDLDLASAAFGTTLINPSPVDPAVAVAMQSTAAAQAPAQQPPQPPPFQPYGLLARPKPNFTMAPEQITIRERGQEPMAPGMPRPPEPVEPALESSASLAAAPRGELQAVPPKPFGKKNRAQLLRERAQVIASNQATGLEPELARMPKPGEAADPMAQAFPGRVERTAGTYVHPGQQSIFDEPQAAAPTAAQQTRQQVGFQVVAADPDGKVFYEGPITNEGNANAHADELYKQFPDALITMKPVEATTSPEMIPDHPSAEPVRDLVAQIADLADPDSPRMGVYVPPDNMRDLAELPEAGVPLANFSVRGDALIAKNNTVANELLAMKREGIPMQAILGYATGAGEGKFVGDNTAVQQRDVEGNVTRETLVPKDQVAQAVGELTEPGREAVILTPEQVIARRVTRIGEEQTAAEQARESRAVRREAGDIAERELPEDTAHEVRQELGTGTLTRAEAGARTLTVAEKLRGRARQRRAMLDVGRPEEYTYYRREIQEAEQERQQAARDLNLDTRDLSADARLRTKGTRTIEGEARKKAAPEKIKALSARIKELKRRGKIAYERDVELYDRLTDAEQQAAISEGADEAQVARERAAAMRHLLALHRRVYRGRTRAEEVVHAASKVSSQAMRAKRREAAQQEFDTTTEQEELDTEESSARELLATLSDEDIRNMKEADIDELFLVAANVVAGSGEVKKGGTRGVAMTGLQAQNVATAAATNVMEPMGGNVHDIVMTEDSPSKRLKFIFRVRQKLERDATSEAPSAPFKSQTGAKIAEAKEALKKSPKKEDRARAKTLGKFQPQALFDLLPAREMSKEKVEAHREQVARIYGKTEKGKHVDGMLDGTLNNLKALLAKLDGPQGAEQANKREPGGNPPHPARDMTYGREYLRYIIQYGEMIKKLKPQSVRGMQEADNFMELMARLVADKPANVATNLAKVLRSELDAQYGKGRRKGLKKRVLDEEDIKRPNMELWGDIEIVDTIERQMAQTAMAKKLHDDLHANAHYETVVMPMMHNLMGWTTSESSGFGQLPVGKSRGRAYRPSSHESQMLSWGLKALREEIPAKQYANLQDWFTERGMSFDADGDLNWKAPRRVTVSKASERFSPQQLSQQIQHEMTSKAFPKEKGRGMSYAQERALKALQRRDPTFLPRERNPLLLKRTLNLSTPALRTSGASLNTLLTAKPTTSLDDVLKQLGYTLAGHETPNLVGLKPGTPHPLVAIVDRLIALNMNVRVLYDNHADMDASTLGRYEVVGGQPVIKINKAAFENDRANGRDADTQLTHTLLHEAVHAATAGAIQRNAHIRFGMRQIMYETRKILLAQGTDPNQYYGMRSVEEFVAEAFSNSLFQSVLRGIDFTHTKTMWDRFIELIRQVFGMTGPNATNMLELVMQTADTTFTGELASEGTSLNLQAADAAKAHINNALDQVDRSGKIRKRVGAVSYDTLENNRARGSKGILSASTMEQIDRLYTNDFGGNDGALHQYLKTFFQRNADNSENMEPGIKLSHRWDKAIEQHGPDAALELSRVMSESTLYGIHPDEKLTAVKTAPTVRRKKGEPKPPPPAPNEHVQSAAQRQRHADLAKRFNALPEDMKKLFRELKTHYKQTLQTESDLHVLNALRAILGEHGFKYTEADVRAKNLYTAEGLEKEFGKRLREEERAAVAKIGRVPQRHVGPYFPLMRFGDHVVTAKRVVAERHFADRKDAAAWRREQKASDPTLTVSHVMGDTSSGFRVVITEKEVRMAESASEAEQNRQEMIAKYGVDNVSDRMTKTSVFQLEGSAIKSDRGLQLLLSKLQGNEAAQAALKDFYLRSMGDNSFRKREIKRTNRRGVGYDDQHRTLAAYTAASSYYTSQLRYGWKLGKEMVRMYKYADEGTSPLSAVKLREVVDELHKRDSFVKDPEKMSTFARRGSSLAQLFMLLSPSYWLINMSQPTMVTLPWLAARTSMADATTALLNAQKMTYHPILQQAGKSKGGLAALWSKSATNEAFSVVDQLIQHIENGQNPRKDEYKNLLQKLKRESIIDMTTASELRTIAEGTYSWRQRILDASRILSHLTEVNNRAISAIAAYDLYRAKGLSIDESTAFAKQAVSVTQFNYSGANSPRLFGENGPFRQFGPIMFQFMKYPQHIWAMLAGSFRMLWKGGAVEKKTALRTLGGLFATHLAMTGLTGAMLQPIKWAIGLGLMMFGDDDESWADVISNKSYDRWMREGIADAFDDSELGNVLATGLPHLVNADVTQRMSLGQLYMIDLNPDSMESLVGSLVGSFGGPLPNLLMGWGQGVQYMYEGQTWKGSEYLMPKAFKDMSRAFRYANDGLTDATGKEILGARDMTPGDLFLQAMGIQPSHVAETYAGRAAITGKRDRERAAHNLWLRRYNAARSPEERNQIRRDIVEFNKAHPIAAISVSQLFKSRQQFQKSEARIRVFGADLRGKEALYAEEGEPYATD